MRDVAFASFASSPICGFVHVSYEAQDNSCIFMKSNKELITFNVEWQYIFLFDQY